MLLNLIPTIAYFIINFISKTLRFELDNIEYILEEKPKGKNFVFAFWHNQFFVMPYFYRKYLKNSHISVLTSLSKDGEYISRVVEKFGFNAIRGSSSRGGENAIRLLIRQLEQGIDVAVTPDGPRGPRHKVQQGVIALAELSGCSIIPVGYKATCKKVLNTWDKFIIPLPFSKGRFVTADPIHIPRDISEADKKQYKIKLENALIAISE